MNLFQAYALTGANTQQSLVAARNPILNARGNKHA